MVPVPSLTSAPVEPEITPAKAELELPAPTERVAPPIITDPLPASDPSELLYPARSRTAPEATEAADWKPKAFEEPALSVPLETTVGPV